MNDRYFADINTNLENIKGKIEGLNGSLQGTLQTELREISKHLKALVKMQGLANAYKYKKIRGDTDLNFEKIKELMEGYIFTAYDDKK